MWKLTGHLRFCETYHRESVAPPGAAGSEGADLRARRPGDRASGRSEEHRAQLRSHCGVSGRSIGYDGIEAHKLSRTFGIVVEAIERMTPQESARQ